MSRARKEIRSLSCRPWQLSQANRYSVQAIGRFFSLEFLHLEVPCLQVCHGMSNPSVLSASPYPENWSKNNRPTKPVLLKYSPAQKSYLPKEIEIMFSSVGVTHQSLKKSSIQISTVAIQGASNHTSTSSRFFTSAEDATTADTLRFWSISQSANRNGAIVFPERRRRLGDSRPPSVFHLWRSCSTTCLFSRGRQSFGASGCGSRPRIGRMLLYHYLQLWVYYHYFGFRW